MEFAFISLNFVAYFTTSTFNAYFAAKTSGVVADRFRLAVVLEAEDPEGSPQCAKFVSPALTTVVSATSLKRDASVTSTVAK
jgi:hypothetical protein